MVRDQNKTGKFKTGRRVLPMTKSSKKRVSLSVKLNLLIISVILLVTVGLVLISYRIYSKRISEYYLSQIESAAQSAKEEILPDMVANFWNEINTDDFIKVHEAALAERDETLIRDWMISRRFPSVPNLISLLP